MSNKRKFEEYQDPDYQSTNNDCVVKKSRVELSESEKLEKIKTIVRREFQNELLQKEQEMLKIDNQLQQCKKLLHRLRYAIVANFYSKKTLSTDNVESSIGGDDGEKQPVGEHQPPPKQQAIHPSLKKLIGKTPINYEELLRYRPTSTRQAAETAKTTIREKLQKKKKDDLSKKSENGTKVPRYIEHIKKNNPIPIMNSSRGRNQTRHLIVVGNTSKFIGDEKSKDGVTHKWLVYIRTKSDVPVNDIIQKVRFFLHPSYKPNDVVDVTSPPFQLSRRGWGEFPVRLQFHFKPIFNQKPIQIIHNLILDKKLTGLQTMGAETIVEIWLASVENNNLIVEEEGHARVVSEKLDLIIQNNTILKEEVIIEEVPIEESVEQNTIHNNIDKIDQNEIPPPVSINPVKLESLNTIQKNGKIYVINPNKKLNKHTNRNQVSLLKSNQLNQSKPEFVLSDHDYLGNNYITPPPGLGSVITKKPTPTTAQPLMAKIEQKIKNNEASLILSKKTIINNNSLNANMSYKKYLENLFLSKLNLETDIRYDVEFLLKKIPLICNDKNSNFIRASYPFIQEQIDNFLKLTKLKRVNYEWSRCKAISILLRKKYQTNIWTTKEVMQFSRYHGYRPDMGLFFDRTSKKTDTSMTAIIKQEINKKNYNNTSTLSLNSRIVKYLDDCSLNVSPLNDVIINVTDTVDLVEESKSEIDKGPLTESDRLKLFIPLHKTLNDDGSFIAETCSNIGITLASEEIVDGILYPATQRILIHCMKYFIEDILRRSCAVKMLNSTDSSPQIEVNDVKNAICSRDEYDFLTNKYLGVKSSNNP